MLKFFFDATLKKKDIKKLKNMEPLIFLDLVFK